MRWLLLVTILSLVGCSSVTSDLEAYCSGTGDCVCHEGDCCVLLDNSCNEGPCCAGLTCQAGRCVGPQLVAAESAEVQAWAPDAGVGPMKSIQFLNQGVGATGHLTTRFGGALDQFEVQDHCATEVLPPNGSCSIDVALAPTILGKPNLDILVEDELGSKATTTVSGFTSGRVVVSSSGSGTGTVHSTPNAFTCSYGTCSTQELPATPITLQADPVGSMFDGWYQLDGSRSDRLGALMSTAPELEVVPAGVTQLVAKFSAFLTVDSNEPIYWLTSDSGVGFQWGSAPGSPYAYTEMTQAFSGTETLTWSPPSYYRPFQWGGACASAGSSDTCTLTVAGPTMVTITGP